MADSAGVQLKGLRQLDRALKVTNQNLRADFRDQLRDIAETISSEARSIAARKRLEDSGDLIRGIRPFVRSGSVGVQSKAVHDGYEYPRRLEFEARGGDVVGPRATLHPALMASLDELNRGLEQLLDNLKRDFDKGI